jgi:two-component system, LuxR family, response regulator FixJ
MTVPATVFLVDDDQAVRDSLRFLMKSVGLPLETFPTAQAFLDRYDPTRPGCLVLDIRMPGMSGLELMEWLEKEESALPVIIITAHADVPMAVQGMKRGALDVIEKPFNDQVLLDHIHEAFRKNEAVRSRRKLRAEVAQRMDRLTPRERQVLDALLEGRENKELAARLGISPKTLGIHRARILEKMKAKTLADLVRMVLNSRATDGL